jgi:hypothetical protein
VEERLRLGRPGAATQAGGLRGIGKQLVGDQHIPPRESRRFLGEAHQPGCPRTWPCGCAGALTFGSVCRSGFCPTSTPSGSEDSLRQPCVQSGAPGTALQTLAGRARLTDRAKRAEWGVFSAAFRHGSTPNDSPLRLRNSRLSLAEKMHSEVVPLRRVRFPFAVDRNAAPLHESSSPPNEPPGRGASVSVAGRQPRRAASPWVAPHAVPLRAGEGRDPRWAKARH